MASTSAQRSASKKPPAIHAKDKNAASKSKPSSNLHRVTKRFSLRDRLSQLTQRSACRLLGQEGEARLRQAAQFEVDPTLHLRLLEDTLVATVPDPDLPAAVARVTLVEMTGRSGGLQLNCDHCGRACLHAAAVLATVLENKLCWDSLNSPIYASRSKT